MAKPIVEPWLAKTVMNRVQDPRMPFRWSLNSYRGCAHGCAFCYARATHAYLGMTPDDAFQTHIFVKSNAAEVLEGQLMKLARKVRYDRRAFLDEIGCLAIGTATDPYQPIEAKSGITRACLEVLRRFEVPISVTTRSPLVLRDLDLLADMDVRSVNVSLGTLDKGVWRNLEPASPSPEKRLDALRALSDRGVRAGVFLAPIIPFLGDSVEALEAVVEAARDHGARFVTPSILRLAPDVKEWFLGVIAERYPRLQGAFRRMYHSSVPPTPYAEAILATAGRLISIAGLARQDWPSETESVEKNSTEFPGFGPKWTRWQTATEQVALPLP